MLNKSALTIAASYFAPALALAASPSHIITGVDAGPTGGHVKSFNGLTLAEEKSFLAYPGFAGGVRVAAGDVNGDGVADIFTATGDGATHVKVFDGVTNNLTSSFFAFGASAGGVYVAAGDLDGDQRADLFAGSASGDSHVTVFNIQTPSPTPIRDFFAYPGFTGGVTVAAGDVNGDGYADIITGSATSATHVKVFDGVSGTETRSFFAYAAGFTGGVYVAAGDINHDGHADIITGAGPGGSPHVKVFDGVTNNEIASFFAFGATFTGGVRVGAADVNGDGYADILAGTGPGASQVNAFDGQTLLELRSFLPYGTDASGVFVAGETPVPEPAMIAPLSIGIALVRLKRRRRRLGH